MHQPMPCSTRPGPISYTWELGGSQDLAQKLCPAGVQSLAGQQGVQQQRQGPQQLGRAAVSCCLEQTEHQLRALLAQEGLHAGAQSLLIPTGQAG